MRKYTGKTIGEADKERSKTETAQAHGILLSMFLTYLKYGDSIKKESLQVEVSKQLRIHGAEHSDLECECFEWFIHARPNNTPVERPTVKE
jgi:hypothetical protein